MTDDMLLAGGREPAPLPPRCGAQTALTDEEIAGIVRWTVSLGWERPFYCLETSAACRLSPGHPHQHAALQAVTREMESLAREARLDPLGRHQPRNPVA